MGISAIRCAARTDCIHTVARSFSRSLSFTLLTYGLVLNGYRSYVSLCQLFVQIAFERQIRTTRCSLLYVIEFFLYNWHSLLLLIHRFRSFVHSLVLRYLSCIHTCVLCSLLCISSLYIYVDECCVVHATDISVGSFCSLSFSPRLRLCMCERMYAYSEWDSIAWIYIYYCYYDSCLIWFRLRVLFLLFFNHSFTHI